MKSSLHILVADRNPHVREFIKREMAAEGHRIDIAENGRELLKRIFRDDTIDLLILDPDLPDAQESALLTKLQDRLPYIPVVFHTFLSDYQNRLDIVNALGYVEKGARSIEHLKRIISDFRKNTGPSTLDAVRKRKQPGK
ncbi:response regulator [Desulfococcus sp.]|uniref:Response regulator receiver protein n=1 Tax=Desulfococcus multivorans DSM 2059 TaxID=1121405 RepID=S7TH42_DESML|nr:two component system response regulator [Desulfococcus multivorans]EPR35925.1 response regulator receiver protein [Desulfococcus multivorans DSM 2059]SJZ35219.1 CheY chemotaxis protein or a CheY-like REC (receiver) domain [Desulfococcus multivorans DSM 2059]